MTEKTLNQIATMTRGNVNIINVYSVEDRLSIRFDKKPIEDCDVLYKFYSLEYAKNITINFNNRLGDDLLSFDHFYNRATGKGSKSYSRLFRFQEKFKQFI